MNTQTIMNASKQYDLYKTVIPVIPQNIFVAHFTHFTRIYINRKLKLLPKWKSQTNLVKFKKCVSAIFSTNIDIMQHIGHQKYIF